MVKALQVLPLQYVRSGPAPSVGSQKRTDGRNLDGHDRSIGTKETTGVPFDERGIDAAMNRLVIRRARENALDRDAVAQHSIEPETEIAHLRVRRERERKVTARLAVE